MQELISVIIPVYNTEKYLKKCVLSVIEQTYGNIEIILVNDGSEDGSSRVINELAENDERIVVIQKENGGLSDARNAGIDIAKGKYICFLDSDDLMEADCLEKAYSSLSENSAQVAIWGYYADFVNENEFIIETKTVNPPFCVVHNGVRGDFSAQAENIGCLGYAWNKLYDRSLIGSQRFIKGVSLIEDILFNEPLLSRAEKIVFTGFAGTHYVQRKRETLGTKRYGNYISLRKQSISARCRIMRKYRVPFSKIMRYRCRALLSTYTKDIRSLYRKKLPDRTKYILRKILLPWRDIPWKHSFSDKRKVFIFLGGFYPNLGDMAVTYAQHRFLENVFPDREIITVPSYDTFSAVPVIKKHIGRDDIVTVTGGGNMDGIYSSLELCRQYVIRSFQKNKTVLFPQSFLSPDEKMSGRSKKIYESHKNLSMFLRDTASWELSKKFFPNVNTYLCPDIVLSLDMTQEQTERKNILCCFRSDKEQLLEDGEKRRILDGLRDKFGEITERDTTDVTKEVCCPDRYEEALYNFLSLLKTCRFAVTDRLHCMIFCVITKTPCIVIDNSNMKISNVYNTWLKDVPYIKMLKTGTYEFVIAALNEINQSDYEFDLSDKFEGLKNVLQDSKKGY